MIFGDLEHSVSRLNEALEEAPSSDGAWLDAWLRRTPLPRRRRSH